jgi:23S rRNA pseudouridine2605 synthase
MNDSTKNTPEKPAQTDVWGEGERIAKRIAASGHCSRREAERLIEARRVKLNGDLVTTPATLVTEKDDIHIDDIALNVPPATPRLWLYHKPAGMLTTHDDPKGRPTVFANLPDDLPRVISVGRLDYNTEGLLLLTTSGELSRALELPKNAFARTYRVRIYGQMDEDKIQALQEGVYFEGMHYKPAEIKVEPLKDNRNQWIRITLSEGKNREVRKLCAFAGLEVSRLIRIAYGPFTLGQLPPEDVKEMTGPKLIELLEKFDIPHTPPHTARPKPSARRRVVRPR